LSRGKPGLTLRVALRLYPPVPINTRFCKKTTALPVGGGPDGRSPLLVREGMPVAYSVYHMQRREDLYGSDTLAFRPERWDIPEIANVGWGYLPFNGGPRVCLGSKLKYKIIDRLSINARFRGLWSHVDFVWYYSCLAGIPQYETCTWRAYRGARG
jgi:cytochrome P450